MKVAGLALILGFIPFPVSPMKTFVINLERSTARRASIQQQLDAQNIPFEFIKAVDGSTLTDEYLAQVCDFQELAKRPHLQHKGMYGCILSHYNIYQRMVADNIPYALILEDDVIIQPGLKAMVDTLEKKVQANEAILLFSQNSYMPTVLSRQHAEALPGNHQLSYPMEPWAFGSTAGYIISLEAARGMVDLVLPIRYGPDTWGYFYDEKAIRSVRCVTPFVVKPAGFKSDIDYIENSSLLGKALNFINEKRIFPFKQLLDYRRKHTLGQATEYTFTDDVSRMVAESVA